MAAVSEHKQRGQLKKHVGAIHSSNTLSLIERKIANALLHHAYQDLATSQEHTISISALCRLIGYSSNDSHRIKKALMALIAAVFEWNLIDSEKGHEVWHASAIIADARIDGAICTYSYSNRMRELLFHPDVYGLIDMDVQAKFKSTYGLALYENCIRYQKIKQTKWITLETFRKLMGVPDNKYRIFRDFKRRVIDGAVAEVNKHSPLQIEAQYKKAGKNVLAVQFVLNPKTPKVAHAAKNTDLSDLLQRTFAASDQQIARLMKNYKTTYIQEKVDLILSSPSYQAGRISHLWSYLQKALREDFKLSSPQPATTDQPRRQHLPEVSERKRLEKAREQYRAYRLDQIAKGYDALPSPEQQQLASAFKQHIQHTVYFNLFVKDGLANILVLDQFCDFLLQKQRDYLEQFNVKSFAEYKSS